MLKFAEDLKNELKRQLEYYNFELTGPCMEWIDSVVDYYVNLGDFDHNDLKTAIDAILDNMDEFEEDNCFAWPSSSEAGAIVSNALHEDSDHFEYITEEQNLSMSPDDCFKAEWFYDGNIRSDIIEFIDEYIMNTENN